MTQARCNYLTDWSMNVLTSSRIDKLSYKHIVEWFNIIEWYHKRLAKLWGKRGYDRTVYQSSDRFGIKVRFCYLMIGGAFWLGNEKGEGRTVTFSISMVKTVQCRNTHVFKFQQTLKQFNDIVMTDIINSYLQKQHFKSI